jgi:DNA-binding transcriptional LysR family regulator
VSDTPDTTALSDEGLLDSAERLLRRLDRHLAAFDAGEDDALDDAAANLRTIVNTGKGDDVLAELLKRFHLPSPNVWLPEQREMVGKVLFAVDAIPVAPGIPPRDNETGALVPFTSWRDMTVLHTPENLKRRWTWQHYIATYANTYGSHTSHSLPKVLSQTKSHGISGLQLAPYLIRRAAVVTLHALQQTLAAAGRNINVPVRDTNWADIPIIGVHYTYVRDPSGDYRNLAVGMQRTGELTLTDAWFEMADGFRVAFTPGRSAPDSPIGTTLEIDLRTGA